MIQRLPLDHAARLLRADPRLLGALAVLLCAALLFAFGGGKAEPARALTRIAESVSRVTAAATAPAKAPETAAAALTIPPPEPEPLVFRDMTRDQARAYNATVGESTLPNPKAARFVLPTADSLSYNRALDCLAAAVHYEAAIEVDAGQRAVAQVVLNRLRHPAYPKTVCGVVFEGHERRSGCQFSFTCDGSLGRMPSEAGWARARAVSATALAGYVYAPVGWATHYHTEWMVAYWAPSLVKLKTVGTHIFYRWQGGWGRPYAFAGRHLGLEPEVSKLAPRSLAHQPPPVATELVEGELPPEVLATELAEIAEPAPAGDSKSAVQVRLSVKGPPLTAPKAARIADASGRVSSEALDWAITGREAAAQPPLGRASDAGKQNCRVTAGSGTGASASLPTIKCDAPATAGSR